MEARGFRPDEETIILPVQSGFEVGVDAATYTMRVYSGHEVEILAVDGMNASGPAVELYGDSGVGSEPEAGVIVANKTVWIARAGQGNKKFINLGKVASFKKVD